MRIGRKILKHPDGISNKRQIKNSGAIIGFFICSKPLKLLN